MKNPMSCDDRLWLAFELYYLDKKNRLLMPETGWEKDYEIFMAGAAVGIRLGGAIMAAAMAQAIK